MEFADDAIEELKGTVCEFDSYPVFVESVIILAPIYGVL